MERVQDTDSGRRLTRPRVQAPHPPITQGIGQVTGCLHSGFGLPTFCKCLRDEQREEDGGIPIDFDGCGVCPDLAPRHCLVGACPAVAAIKLLGCVEVHSKVGAVAHEVGVADVVLGNT